MFLCRATYLVMQCIGGYMQKALGMQMTRASLPVLPAVCIGVPSGVCVGMPSVLAG